jgi:1-deoxy-D-xylulose-5-phosphate reductoisomerase
MDWSRNFALRFEPPDLDRFGALRVAYQVAEAGGTAGAVMNAANEEAVAAFADGRISFGEICRIVELTISRHRVQPEPTLDDVVEADRWARSTAASLTRKLPDSELTTCR